MSKQDVQAGDANEQDLLDEQFKEEDAQLEKTDEELSEEKQTEEVPEEKPEDKPVRPVYTMPVSKAQEEKKRAIEKAKQEAQAEYEAKIESMKAEYEAKLSQGKPTSNLDEKLRKLAEEKNLDYDVAKDLLDVFKESVEVPDFSKYDQLLEKQEIENHRISVLKEFDEDVVPLIKKDYPSVSDSHLNKIKKDIEQLAFSSRFNTYSVADIYLVNRDKFEYKDGYTAEDPGGRTTSQESLGDLTEEEAMKLPTEQYVAWQDIQANKQSSFVDL